MRLGVVGGTFDPVHNAHLVAAEEARFQFDLERVVFIPSARPPHRAGAPHATAEDRYRMIELAIEGNPHMEVSRIEVERDGLSYTIDTLRELHLMYGADTELYFIAGADEVLDIRSWKDPESVLAECFLVAASRPGFSLDHLAEAIPERISTGESSTGRVLPMEMPALDISATDIRARAAVGRPFRYLVPEAVWLYIVEKRLYVER